MLSGHPSAPIHRHEYRHQFSHQAMVKKTRDKFIEVARQLFARKGVENTTMHDIASASDKGRRTIYTLSLIHI